jgi:hypothetical protein
MKKTPLAMLAVLLLMLLVTETVNASTSYTFSGSVYAVDSTLAGSFSNGQTITGSYTVETTTVGSSGGSDTTFYNSALTSFSATIGGYTVSLGGSNRIDVVNNSSYDRYIVETWAPSGSNVASMPVSYLFFSLDDPSGVVLSNSSLPLSASTLNSFTSKSGVIAFGEGDGNRVTFSVNNITQSPVPIPGAAWLLGSGLVGLVGLGRKRQSK